MVINREWAYWYAVGYYEGRAVGDCYVDSKPSMPDKDELQAAMKEGYEAGVTDYCTYDEPEEV